MKKFKCYKCGAIAAVDDSAQRATCPNCGTVCSLMPAQPQVRQEAPVRQDTQEREGAQGGVAPAPMPVKAPAAPNVPAVAPAPAPQNAGMMPFPPVGAGGAAEYAERAAIIGILERYVPRKSYGILVQTIMTAPMPMVRNTLNVKLRSAAVTAALSWMFFYTGIDRLYAGYIALGVCKWIFGCFTAFIWNMVDLFVSNGDARKKNLERILAACGMQPAPSKQKKEKE